MSGRAHQGYAGDPDLPMSERSLGLPRLEGAPIRQQQWLRTENLPGFRRCA